MQRIGSFGIALSLLLASAPLRAQDEAASEQPKEKITAEKKKPKKKKSDFSFKLNGALSGGFDSNSYNRAENNTIAGIGDVRVGTKLGYHIVPRLSWTAGLDLGLPVRGGSQTALKVKAGAKTGINWLVFGMKKIPGGKKVAKKKQVFPAGVLSLTGKYAFSANPVVQTFEAPPVEGGEGEGEGEGGEEEIPIDEELEYVGDPEIDEVLEDEDVDADDFGDDEDYDDDDGGEEEEAAADELDEEEEEEDVDDFVEVDTISESFGLANPKHNAGVDLKLAINPWKKTTIGLGGVVDRSMVGAAPGKVSANSTRYGASIKVKQKLAMFGVGAQYGFDYRSFDEKAPKSDPSLYLSFFVHKPGVFVDAKFFKRLKLKLSYGYQSRLTGLEEEPLDAFKHNVKLGTKLKLTSFMGLFAQAGYGFQGQMISTDKDASRFQGVLGLQFKM
jgi:hypothetical protein